MDKFDYIRRDTRNTNVKWGFDSDRLIHASRGFNGHMAYHAREVYSSYDMCTTRFKLHKVRAACMTNCPFDYCGHLCIVQVEAIANEL